MHGGGDDRDRVAAPVDGRRGAYRQAQMRGAVALGIAVEEAQHLDARALARCLHPRAHAGRSVDVGASQLAAQTRVRREQVVAQLLE
jgi:hypothetical protein